jgi:cyclopropane fatty-acyl-phospholipid synthase-like methyltransferase
MVDESEFFAKMTARYESGEVPWNDPLPPPEVISLLSSLAPGRALDLGCGYGRAAIYMARKGWDVDGVDFVPEAVAEAARRTRRAGVNVRYHICDVVDLDFLAGPYDFALDVGCGHNLTAERWRLYHDQLRRLLRPNAGFLLFARLKEPATARSELGAGGLSEEMLLSTFSEGFRLEGREEGQTDVPGQQSWPSAWYRFSRRG